MYSSVLLHKFGEFTDSIKLKQFADCFPNTMLKGHKFQAISRDDYQKLVVCGRCNCTYEYDDLKCLGKFRIASTWHLQSILHV